VRRRLLAAFGSTVYFCVAPGVVVGAGPWLVTRWQMREPFPYYLPVRVLGLLLLVSAVGFLVAAFARFVLEGLGTPAPVAPTAQLVVGGAYRFVRNPMYLAVVAAIAGQALWLGRPVLLGYAAAIAGLQAAFVRFYEEPALRRRYGAGYDAYRAAVPAWWPRGLPGRGRRVR
jgi:protein-S-isoprenylcysteine O-methyltransferase Ste14